MPNGSTACRPPWPAVASADGRHGRRCRPRAAPRRSPALPARVAGSALDDRTRAACRCGSRFPRPGLATGRTRVAPLTRPRRRGETRAPRARAGAGCRQCGRARRSRPARRSGERERSAPARYARPRRASRHALQREQPALVVEPERAVPAEPVRPHHSVAGNDDPEAVRRHRRSPLRAPRRDARKAQRARRTSLSRHVRTPRRASTTAA